MPEAGGLAGDGTSVLASPGTSTAITAPRSAAAPVPHTAAQQTAWRALQAVTRRLGQGTPAEAPATGHSKRKTTCAWSRDPDSDATRSSGRYSPTRSAPSFRTDT